jgi:hypothetical protein
MSIKYRIPALTLAALISAAAAGNAQACGEVMYRMGGALRYHAFITRHPAEILVYVGSATEQAVSADHEGFHRNLEKAGHKVTQVQGPEALTQALATHHFDVIITYAADLPAINAQLAHAAKEPTLIPVFQRGSDDSIRKQYPLALNEDANLNQFLKTIEQSMKARGT